MAASENGHQLLSLFGLCFEPVCAFQKFLLLFAGWHCGRALAIFFSGLKEAFLEGAGLCIPVTWAHDNLAILIVINAYFTKPFLRALQALKRALPEQPFRGDIPVFNIGEKHRVHPGRPRLPPPSGWSVAKGITRTNPE
jgi:hypothetical protein